ncbi:uncharacterized protein LOC106867775 [Octopus bimaculoides]|nr:uncharacterized protein LOC106867775 [Octopus bimaculoides]XP_014768245.1 uncharacterized protein LOC106867775 [Octopus bimaculoides]XP_052828517.1 uncharacterized protein LOC106867775 [Octopus bimaculoides]|eukprot:XP_014768244.1 PREDICTED: uncharacterized protein LOC106867775 [Octopus bimaculoides]
MRLSIAFALLSLSLCQAENNSSDTGRILDGSWSSEENLVLTFDQRNNSLSATLIISCSRGYNFTGNITNSNTFHLYGAFNTTAMAVTGQLYKTNQNKILKITLMKYDYANCTNYTPTKISFHELKPSQNISKSTATQTSYNWYNYLADMWSFENFKQEDANCSLEGTWYNDLGSTMVVKQNEDGLLEGQFRTSVERFNGSSGGFKANIYGAISPYSVFSFGLVWNEGTSISSFVGQCIPSSNNATFLKTQWTMLVGQETFDTSWKAFYNGMNNFYKDPEGSFARIWSSEEGIGIEFKGPNHALMAEVVFPCGRQYNVKGAMTNNHTFYLYGANQTTAIGVTGLFFITKNGQLLKITLVKYDYANCSEYTPAKISSHELKPTQTLSYNSNLWMYHNYDDYIAGFWDFRAYNEASSCNLNGTWYNELGSSMTITQKDDGSLEGQYNTAVERSNGTSGGGKADLHGTISYSVFSFGVVWNEGSSITVFSGQCIPSSSNGIELKAHWSLVAAQRSVEISWKAFYTGMDNFYKDSKEE